ncbi:universal stress protein UspA [Shewanella sp. Scap07]|uniref:universal stress protein n=1 Tax=Shewanella sp. Scap07 TaxID=2589987 RepID=UPI0015C082C7|nr:universal stress protein [Shewanella sp. Scap07]QLE86607.1 universal stress protein UspA [Shewanella sp. Scap07]
MDKLYIIAQKDQQQTDAVSSGIALAQQLNLRPEIGAYSYESLSGDAYDHDVADSAQAQVMAADKAAIDDLLHRLDACQTPITQNWCKHLAEHACQHVRPENYAMMLKSIHESEQFLPADWQLIRNTQVPLMLMSNKPLNKPESILMAVDLGTNKPDKQRLNQAIIAQAKRLEAASGCQLHLGFVVRVPKILRDMDIVNTRTLIKDAYEKYQQAIAETGLARDQVHILAGNADMCLFELSCRLKAQYLVMGIHKKQGIFGHIIGNTSEAILGRMRSNILVVPSTR